MVDNMEDAYQEAKNILGMSIKGLPVNQVLVSEAIDIAAEYYVGFTIDRNTRSVVLMLSASGGMDIEEVARRAPEKIIRYSIDPFISPMVMLRHVWERFTTPFSINVMKEGVVL